MDLDELLEDLMELAGGDRPGTWRVYLFGEYGEGDLRPEMLQVSERDNALVINMGGIQMGHRPLKEFINAD